MGSPQEKQASGNILRMLIPAMAKHDAACHPLSYAVWYATLAGNHPMLKDDINTLLATGTKLADADIEALYQRHILKRDIHADRHAETQLRALLDEVCRLTHAAGSSAGEFHHTLVRCGSELHAVQDPCSLGMIAQALMRNTAVLQQSIADLKTGIQARNQQIDSLRQKADIAQEDAHKDPLTGLLNRRGLQEAFAAFNLNERTLGTATPAMIFADIDHFARINASYGHATGDQVIRSVGQILEAKLNGERSVARLGGENFAILVDKTSLNGAKNLAERLRSVILNARFRRNDTREELRITMSFGAAVYAVDETLEDLLHRADMALYAAKKTGRNKVNVAPNVQPIDWPRIEAIVKRPQL